MSSRGVRYFNCCRLLVPFSFWVDSDWMCNSTSCMDFPLFMFRFTHHRGRCFIKHCCLKKREFKVIPVIMVRNSFSTSFFYPSPSFLSFTQIHVFVCVLTSVSLLWCFDKGRRKELFGSIPSIFSLYHLKLLAVLHWQPDLDIHCICGFHWSCKSTINRFFIVALIYQECGLLDISLMLLTKRRTPFYSRKLYSEFAIFPITHSHDIYSISDVSSMKEGFSFMNLVRFSSLVCLQNRSSS